jgi:hypothetical protein
MEGQGIKAPITGAVSAPAGEKNHEDWHTAEEEEQISFKITKLMSYRPWTVCGSFFSLILIIVIVVSATGMGGISEDSQYDWDVPNGSASRNNDAVNEAVEQVDILGNSGERTLTYDQLFFFLFTSRDGSDLYTPENLQDMCLVEGLLAQDPLLLDFCQLDEQGNCMLPRSSIVVYFYDFQSIASWNCTLLDASVVDQKKGTIYASLDTGDFQQFGLWLSKDSLDNGFSTKAESVWSFGAPLAGYETPTDRSDEQVILLCENLSLPIYSCLYKLIFVYFLDLFCLFLV